MLSAIELRNWNWIGNTAGKTCVSPEVHGHLSMAIYNHRLRLSAVILYCTRLLRYKPRTNLSDAKSRHVVLFKAENVQAWSGLYLIGARQHELNSIFHVATANTAENTPLFSQRVMRGAAGEVCLSTITKIYLPLSIAARKKFCMYMYVLYVHHTASATELFTRRGVSWRAVTSTCNWTGLTFTYGISQILRWRLKKRQQLKYWSTSFDATYCMSKTYTNRSFTVYSMSKDSLNQLQTKKCSPIKKCSKEF